MQKPTTVALLGAGRAGREHAKNLGTLPAVRVLCVCDPVLAAAESAAVLARAEGVTTSADQALARADIDAVIISTPTETHADYMERAARSGKAIFCEKPVSLDLTRATEAVQTVRDCGVPFQIGFDRRFDPGYAEVKRRLDEGALGQTDQFVALSRDPAPPPREYLAKSGGLMIDSAIHDFDIARFWMGAGGAGCFWGAGRCRAAAGAVGAGPRAPTLLRFASGAQGMLQNCRRAAYGYDIYSEVSGELGKLVVHAESKTPFYHYRKGGWERDYHSFFMDRFGVAFRDELVAFFDSLSRGESPSPGLTDALEALRIATAATKSLREKRPVRLDELV